MALGEEGGGERAEWALQVHTLGAAPHLTRAGPSLPGNEPGPMGNILKWHQVPRNRIHGAPETSSAIHPRFSHQTCWGDQERSL